MNCQIGRLNFFLSETYSKPIWNCSVTAISLALLRSCVALEHTNMAHEHLREEGTCCPHTEQMIPVGVRLTASTREFPNFLQDVCLLSFETARHDRVGKKWLGKIKQGTNKHEDNSKAEQRYCRVWYGTPLTVGTSNKCHFKWWTSKMGFSDEFYRVVRAVSERICTEHPCKQKEKQN